MDIWVYVCVCMYVGIHLCESLIYLITLFFNLFDTVNVVMFDSDTLVVCSIYQ